MFALELFVKLNLMPGSDYSCAQFDVFNGRPVVSFIKSAQLPENSTSDGATGAPKSGSGFLGILMNVMMKKVFILGEKIIGRRFVIVRSDDRSQLRIVVESSLYTSNCVLGYGYIGVYEEQQVTPGMQRA